MAKPEIRLRGFEGEWNAVQLKNILTERRAISTITDELPQLSFTIQEGVIFPQERKSNKRDFLIKDITNKKYLVTKYDDIIYNPANVIHGAIHRNALCDGVVSPIYKIFESDQNAKYVESLVRRASFIKNMTVFMEGTVLKLRTLKPESFLNMNTYIAGSLEEQNQIADYFKSLDSMIQGVTKKITSLKQMKQACLVSMFPQEGETTPRVRFKGFKGEWEKKILNDCLDISHEKNLDNRYGKNDVLSVSDDCGVMNQIELLGRSYAGKSVSNYGVLNNGEIVYTKSPLKSKPYGIVKMNTGKTGIVSVLYAIYVAKENTSTGFIHYYFDPAWRLNAYLLPLVNKGAKNTMNISDEMALTGYIMIPKDIREQQKIATYFTSLDKQISLQEARLEKLKQIKSACLDKMFV
jgi:type I restriction enzyme S subunit